MKKILFCLALALPTTAFSATSNDTTENTQYTLEQVFTFSRHGIRAPLAVPGTVPYKASAREWPKWSTPSGLLTANGGIVEMRMGHYFSEWLISENLFPAKGCPDQKDIYITANNIQRTLATGQYFSAGAFPGCNIPVHFTGTMGKMQPLYSPELPEEYKQLKPQLISAISKNADAKTGMDGFNKKFANHYKTLETLIQFDKSEYCLKDKICKFTDLPSKININKHGMFTLEGPMELGDAISEIFLLQYYEGFPLDQVAWGEKLSEQQWQRLADIKSQYHRLAFGTPEVVKYTQKELLQYLNNAIKQGNTQPKFNMAVGHDVNVAALLDVLQIKPFTLPGQYERTPVSVKLVFERWLDNKTNEQKLKIEYIYQTKEQIRNQDTLDLNNPPQRITLEMAECPIDKNGFCSLADFERFMKKIML